MSDLPLLTGKQVGKIISKLGYEYVKHTGSHMTFINKNNHQKIIIPDHGSEKIGFGLLNKIIKKDLGITREEFLELL